MKENYIKRLILALPKLAFLSLASAFILIPGTNAFFTDSGQSSDNLMTAGTLDITANSTESNFTPMSAMQPGDIVERNVILTSTGTLGSQYKGFYQYSSGDVDLCNNLQLEVDYQYFTATPSGPSDFSSLQSVVKYNGPLSAFSDFDTNSPTHDPDLVLPTNKTYYTNSYYNSGQAWLVYKITLPSGADLSLQNKSCGFNLQTTAWQQNLASSSQGFSDTAIISGSVSSGSWGGVVLNEIYPNPVGGDAGTRPRGEWVELYNNSGSDVDVNGWVIEDAASHHFTITQYNSDNDLNLATGESIVPAHGWLTTYFEGSVFLNNTTDETVILRDGLGGNLIDSHSYSAPAPEGKSYARIPDGVGVWVDPVPTPGRANANTTADLTPTIKIWQQDPENAKIGIFDAVAYPGADYLITYGHSEDGGETILTEAITGHMDINDQDEFKENLYFGTCSTGGTCVPHHNITNVHLHVDFPDSGRPSLTLETDMAGSWTESSAPAR